VKLRTAFYRRIVWTTLTDPWTTLIVAVFASVASGPHKWRDAWATQLY